MTIDIHGRLENKKPTEGEFTVESDREIMELLDMIAYAITGRIDRGGTFNLFSKDEIMAAREEAPSNSEIKANTEKFYNLEPGAIDAARAGAAAAMAN